MPISKQEAIHSTEEEKRLLERAQKIIDTQLRRDYVEGKRVWVNLNDIFQDSDISFPRRKRLIQQIIQIYEKLGWEVYHHTSQQGGSSLSFE